MEYPLQLRFKLWSIGQQIIAKDATDKQLMFIKQKMFKLKEKIEIYPDSSKGSVIFRIEADRMIDWSANYSFTDADGNDWGAVRRKGMASIWSARYDVMQDGEVDMNIREESPFKKVVEGLAGGIPVLGFIVSYLLNPSYLVSRPDGTPLLRLTKHPAFFEGKFSVEKLSEIPRR